MSKTSCKHLLQLSVRPHRPVSRLAARSRRVPPWLDPPVLSVKTRTMNPGSRKCNRKRRRPAVRRVGGCTISHYPVYTYGNVILLYNVMLEFFAQTQHSQPHSVSGRLACHVVGSGWFLNVAAASRTEGRGGNVSLSAAATRPPRTGMLTTSTETSSLSSLVLGLLSGVDADGGAQPG